MRFISGILTIAIALIYFLFSINSFGEERYLVAFFQFFGCLIFILAFFETRDM